MTTSTDIPSAADGEPAAPRNDTPGLSDAPTPEVTPPEADVAGPVAVPTGKKAKGKKAKKPEKAKKAKGNKGKKAKARKGRKDKGRKGKR